MLNMGCDGEAVCERDDQEFGPLSSEDVAVVVDFNWFIDCHLEAIFNMNTSRVPLDLQSLLTGKIFVRLPVFLSEPGSARYSSATSITTV